MTTGNRPQRTDLQHRLRNAARWSLYLALAIVFATGTALWAFLRDDFRIVLSHWYDVDFLEYESVRDLQELVRIDTTLETGREIDGARWIAEELAEVGIESQIEELPGGKANLWAEIEGRTDEFLVLHSHLDTDPIGDPDLWMFEPWSGDIDVVWLRGRGSFDMKSTIVAQVHTMQEVQRQIQRTGIRPTRGILLLSTSSEETGSHEGTQRIIAERPELLDGAWALFSEGGVVEAIDFNEVKYLGVSFGQKRFVDVWYSAPSQEELEAFAAELRAREQPQELRVTEPVRTFLRVYAPTRVDPAIRGALSSPDRVVADPEVFADVPEFYKALFRDEVHVLPVESAPEGGFRLRTVLHLLEDSNVQASIRQLLPAPTAHPDIERWVDPSIGSRDSSPLDHPAYVGLMEALRTELEDAPVGPYYLTYFANDAQFFRKLGIPSYGFQPFLGVPADSYTVGRYNERIALPAFVEGVERYVDIMSSLVR